MKKQINEQINAQINVLENQISHTLSRVPVDTAGLRDKLANTLSTGAAPTAPPRRPLSPLKAMAVALVLVALTTTVFASAGGLDLFISRFNPTFGAFAIPPAYPATDTVDGIRLEIIGANQVYNMLLLYFTLEDTTGQHRLTIDHFPFMEVYRGGELLSSGSSSQRLHFDRTANRLYFEKILRTPIEPDPSDHIALVVEYINDFSNPYGTGQISRLPLDPANTPGDGPPGWHIATHANSQGSYLTWHDKPFLDGTLAHLIVTPFGVQVEATHPVYSNLARIAHHLEIHLEIGGRRRPLRTFSQGGGFGPTSFDTTITSSQVIEVDRITAVYVNGNRFDVRACSH